MRSDRDKRTDSEREIDDFLAKFETPADELSADISSYLDEQSTEKSSTASTFQWKIPGSSEQKESSASAEVSDSGSDKKTIIVNGGDLKITPG